MLSRSVTSFLFITSSLLQNFSTGILSRPLFYFTKTTERTQNRKRFSFYLETALSQLWISLRCSWLAWETPLFKLPLWFKRWTPAHPKVSLLGSFASNSFTSGLTLLHIIKYWRLPLFLWFAFGEKSSPPAWVTRGKKNQQDPPLSEVKAFTTV